MCCITRYVINHFYGEGRKCCGLILHCAHSAAHFHASVCLWVCGEGFETSVGISAVFVFTLVQTCCSV